MGQSSLPGLHGKQNLIHWAHGHSCPNISIWGMDTCQPNSGWPEQLSAVAKEPQETELGWLTICLNWWQGCHQRELSFVPALGHWGCVPSPASCARAAGTPLCHHLQPLALLLALAMGQQGMPGWKWTGALHSLGASLEGKHRSQASFPVHLVSLGLDGHVKWQGSCAELGRLMGRGR